MSPFIARNVSSMKGSAVFSCPAVPIGDSASAYCIFTPRREPSPTVLIICLFR